ncbi:MAG: M13 family metallopeptidase [Bacteroidales bacterium]|nr:M13 family metallopeptidase [Bacteroidales bacterium]
MYRRFIGISLLLFIMVTGCNNKNSNEELQSGINRANLDTTANPKDDFYQYACGGWMKLHPLPSEYARYGSFDKLAEDNQQQIKDLILELAGAKNKQNSIAQKIGDLYNLGMDSLTLNNQGAQPLENGLQTIANIKNKTELEAQISDMHLSGISAFFGLFGEAHPTNSDLTIAWLWQSGMGMGDRDYYLTKEDENLRQEYKKLMAQLFALSGYSRMVGKQGQETAMAEAVFALENNLAKVAMDKNDRRDPQKTFNYMALPELKQMFSNFDIEKYLSALGLAELDSINVGQPEYFKGLNTLLQKTSLEDIKLYLAWMSILNAAPYLSDEFVDIHFNYYGKILSGKEENRPRWKRVVGVVNGTLIEAVGQMYVDKYFPKEAKARMLNLVENLKAALKTRIEENTWMTDETKVAALEKLSTFHVKIGYPDKWRDYSGLKIENDSYYANIMRSNRFETAYQLSKINKPVDKNEWLMSPQTVNAYYNPTTNEICFPAGILQPPFFDMNADDAANYGAIGVVIGHEMTHGFDDHGSQYDKDGNLKNWWKEEDAEHFAQRTQVLVDHFNAIEVLPGIHADGKFTLGENIADNGGLQVAFLAMSNAIANGEIKDMLDGFTPQQRFFLAYANVWASNIRDEEIKKRTKEDVHSLGKWRVNGTLQHINAFFEAFDIHEGDKMYLAPEKRALIW